MADSRWRVNQICFLKSLSECLDFFPTAFIVSVSPSALSRPPSKVDRQSIHTLCNLNYVMAVINCFYSYNKHRLINIQ